MPKSIGVFPSKTAIRVRVRCWVEVDGLKLFTSGPFDLLHLIINYGYVSLSEKSMDMSYKKAWALIDEMNRIANEPYVITNKGGRRGGGAEITPAGKKAMADFKRLNNKIASIIRSERAFLTNFSPRRRKVGAENK